MGAFILNRALYGMLVLIGVVVVVFFLFNVLPADPARLVMGQRSDVSSLEQINKELGRDKSLPVQFLLYLNDLSPLSVHSLSPASHSFYTPEKYSHALKLLPLGKDKVLLLKLPYLRRSYQTKRKVTDIFLDVLPNTLVLSIAAMLIATFLGIFLGIYASVKKDTWQDNIILVFSALGTSLPSFFAGILIAWLFGFVLHSYTGLNMTGSLYETDPFTGDHLVLKNLILPAIALGIRPLAIIVQLMRSAMLDELSKDYIRTARAKGLPRNVILMKHALKNALNPVITVISGWFASLLSGAFFIEYIFGWRGLGKVTVEALEKYDFPVVIGAVLLVALIFVTINICVDILYGWLNPRVRIA